MNVKCSLRCKYLRHHDSVKLSEEDRGVERLDRVYEWQKTHGTSLTCEHKSCTQQKKSLVRFFPDSQVNCAWFEPWVKGEEEETETPTADTDKKYSKLLMEVFDKITFCHPSCYHFRYMSSSILDMLGGRFCTLNTSRHDKEIRTGSGLFSMFSTDENGEVQLDKETLLPYLHIKNNKNHTLRGWGKKSIFGEYGVDTHVQLQAQYLLRDIYGDVCRKDRLSKELVSTLIPQRVILPFVNRSIPLDVKKMVAVERLTNCKDYHPCPVPVRGRAPEFKSVLEGCGTCTNKLGDMCVNGYDTSDDSCPHKDDNLLGLLRYEMDTEDYATFSDGPLFTRKLLNLEKDEIEDSCYRCIHSPQGHSYCYERMSIVDRLPEFTAGIGDPSPCTYYQLVEDKRQTEERAYIKEMKGKALNLYGD